MLTYVIDADESLFSKKLTLIEDIISPTMYKPAYLRD